MTLLLTVRKVSINFDNKIITFTTIKTFSWRDIFVINVDSVFVKKYAKYKFYTITLYQTASGTCE